MFKVLRIIDGDTFVISPNWQWNSETGDRVRPLGYDTPEEGDPGFNNATKKLEELLLHKKVELKNPVDISYGRLLCDVYLNGVNIATYFSQYAR